MIIILISKAWSCYGFSSPWAHLVKDNFSAEITVTIRQFSPWNQRRSSSNTSLHVPTFSVFDFLRTTCLLPAVPLEGHLSVVYLCGALHVVLMLRAPELEKKKPLESENQSDRLSSFAIPSLSAKLPEHLLITVPRLSHSPSCLWQEDGTGIEASSTRTRGLTGWLAVGLLRQSCRFTPGSCSYFCV